jgi:tRNA(fMet)-specific endonuclease VapC
MKYLLDTNACIAYLNGKSERLKQKMQEIDISNIYLCSIVKTELFYGVARSQFPERNQQKLLRFFSEFNSFPFDDHAAEIAGQIRAQLNQQGTPIGPHDVLIAAIALSQHLVLVTHNTQEFSRIKELKIEDWE